MSALASNVISSAGVSLITEEAVANKGPTHILQHVPVWTSNARGGPSTKTGRLQCSRRSGARSCGGPSHSRSQPRLETSGRTGQVSESGGPVSRAEQAEAVLDLEPHASGDVCGEPQCIENKGRMVHLLRDGFDMNVFRVLLEYTRAFCSRRVVEEGATHSTSTSPSVLS